MTKPNGKKNLNTRKFIAGGTIVLIVLVAMLGYWWWQGSTAAKGDEPLYWVAPMDPNYRRDKPGKSPMGMDLVPVYAEEKSAPEPEAGVVSIAPEVQNQMGVRTQAAIVDDLKPVLQTQGRIVFDQTLIAKLSPRVIGWVDAVYVETEGEAVKRGQPLYSLYSPELIEAQQHYLDALENGAQRDIHRAESKLKTFEMDTVALKQLKDERAVQETVVFRAPKDGVIGMLNITEGNYVEPGDLLLAIGTLETVWAEFNVFASQAGLIRPRQLIAMTTPSHPGSVWEGEVDYIFPALDADSHSLRFRAIIENPAMRLKPNMFVQGTVTLPEREPEVLIPNQAVIRLGEDNRVVLSLGDGRFKSVMVTLGETDGTRIEILDGLEEGDQVVSSAQFLIDSESSKTSDFRRMEDPEENANPYPPTWVRATITGVDLVERTLKLKHEKIRAWSMPSMTMNFQATDELDFTGLEEGDRIEALVADGDPLFLIKDVRLLEAIDSQ